MTRILLVSDLHYALPQLDWVVGAASSFDIVVFAGDHLDISSPVPPEAQIVVLLKYFELVAEHIQVIVASGNHDLTARDGHGEKSAPWLAHALGERTRIDGDILDRHDLRITVCPWWDGPAGRARVDELLERAGTDRPARWLWVYHWPPDETRVSWTGRKHYGDRDLTAWIDRHRPDLVLTGHVHDPPFKPAGHWIDRVGSTWVCNPGRQIGPVPAHIVIDLDRQLATWHSYLGTEEQQLDGPPVSERPCL